MAQSVDEILMGNRELAGSAQEKYAEREMRQSRVQKEEMPDETKQPTSFRERVIAARRAMDLKQRAKDKLEEKFSKIASKISLNSLWSLTGSVIGFLPGILIVDTIVFMKATGMTFKIADKIKFKLKDIILLIFFNTILLILILFVASFFINESILEIMQEETEKSTTQTGSSVK